MINPIQFKAEIEDTLGDLIGVRKVDNFQTPAISLAYSTEIIEGIITGLEVVIDLYFDIKSEPLLHSSINRNTFTVILKQWQVDITEDPSKITYITEAQTRLANKYKNDVRFIPIKLEPGLNILSVVSCQITYKEYNLND